MKVESRLSLQEITYRHDGKYQLLPDSQRNRATNFSIMSYHDKLITMTNKFVHVKHVIMLV